MFAQGYFDMIWASPPCTEYSRALTRRPRRLEEGDRAAIRTVELIRDLRPRFCALRTAEAPALHGELALVRCDLLQVWLRLQESDSVVAQLALGARARPLLRKFARRAVQSQWRAASFGCAAGHVPPQGRGRAKLPKPGAALQHPRGAVQGDRFGRQRSRGDSPRLVLGFLGFSKASTLACSFLQTPHSP